MNDMDWSGWIIRGKRTWNLLGPSQARARRLRGVSLNDRLANRPGPACATFSLVPRMKKPVTAHFVPRWPENPYHRELAAHLEPFGVSVLKESVLKTIYEQARAGGTRPDIVHLHALPRFSWRPLNVLRLLQFIRRIRVLQRMGVKFVWTIHDVFHHEAFHPRIERILSRLFLRLADAVIVHSPAARKAVEDLWKVSRNEGVFIVPHGNYIDSYSNQIGKQAARAKLALPLEPMLFLFLGHIRPYKGVAALIDIFRALPDQNIRLLIAGKPISAEMAADVQRRIQDCPRIRADLGFVRDEEIQVYMNAADAVVFPYAKSLTSGALVLAMSFGRACIAPRLGAAEDMLDNSGGFLYDPASPRGLQDALEAAIRRRGELDEMGTNSRRRAEAWDWTEVARLTARVYRCCLGDSERVESAPVSR
jgi:beta-1,4-mannosyltransferase